MISILIYFRLMLFAVILIHFIYQLYILLENFPENDNFLE